MVARSVDDVEEDVGVAVTWAEEVPRVLAVADEVPEVVAGADDAASRDELRAIDEVCEPPRTLESAALEALRVELALRLADRAVEAALTAREEPARVAVAPALDARDAVDAPTDDTDAVALPLRSALTSLDEAGTLE